MNSTGKPLVEPWLRRTLRVLVAAGFGLVALNFCARWWYWQVRVPEARLMATRADAAQGWVALLWAAATVGCGFALYDMLGTLPRIMGRARWSLAGAAALAAIAWVAAS